eukprot:445335-Prymnesium_polylepis.1
MRDFRPPALTHGRPGVPARAFSARACACLALCGFCACAAWRPPGPAQCAMRVGRAQLRVRVRVRMHARVRV